MYDSRKRDRIERYDFRVKVGVLLASVATLGLLAVAAYRENFLPAWRQYQLAYREILFEVAGDERERKIAEDFPVELRQLVVPELGLVDRCISCHLGVEDPRLRDREQPFRTHPGDFLSTHEPARFGCTPCHQGQGRATEVAAAHGRVPHWEEPLIERQFIYSACGRCHAEGDPFGTPSGLFARDEPRTILRSVTRDEATTSPLLARGRELFLEKGCLGCHAYRGKGGTSGPDLTYVGDKTRHDFDFSHFESHEPRTVEAWLQKHFLQPQQISPGTIMPPLDLGERDVAALTSYMMSLKSKSAVPASHRPPPPRGELREATGEELYSLLCAACHGQDGRQSEVPGLRTPALNNADFLAVASDDYLRFNIARGRSGTAMPSWGESLDRDSIDRLVAHVRRWEPPAADLRGVSSRRGDAARGRALYLGNCANCHGARGEGGIGVALNSSTFLAIASDDFLARTIIHGRPGTAMPDWRVLDETAVSDLLAYLRSWDAREHDRQEVVALSHSLEDALSIGRVTYRSNCAPCHGVRGEGGIGVNLAANDFLARVDREYLFDAVTRGRPGTAMPGWNHLNDEQIAGVIALLKSWQQSEDIADAGALPRGNWQLGEVTYRHACASCHGPQGQGATGPQIANPVFLQSASDSQLYAWIGHGKAGTAMKGFLREEQGIVTLTRGQILDVIAYLRHAALGPKPLPTPTGVGDASQGAELYADNCAACHGADGEGGSGPQLNNPVFLASASDGFLAATIVLGRTGTAMRSMVHGREGLGQISPEDVDDVIAYLRRWSTPDRWRSPRPVAELTAQDIASGETLYRQFCSGCHGPQGRGVADGVDYFAPALNNPEFLESASDGFLLATIARGRKGTPMRPFGFAAGGIADLDDGQILDIVSYLRSWQFPTSHDVLAGPPATQPASQVNPSDPGGK